MHVNAGANSFSIGILQLNFMIVLILGLGPVSPGGVCTFLITKFSPGICKEFMSNLINGLLIGSHPNAGWRSLRPKQLISTETSIHLGMMEYSGILSFSSYRLNDISISPLSDFPKDRGTHLGVLGMLQPLAASDRGIVHIPIRSSDEKSSASITYMINGGLSSSDDSSNSITSVSYHIGLSVFGLVLDFIVTPQQ